MVIKFKSPQPDDPRLKLRAMGIDPSTKTGLSLIWTSAVSGEEVVSTRVIHYPQSKGYDRLQLIAHEFGQVLQEWQPSIAVIEGYAYGNKFTLADLVEIGSQMRLALHNAKVPWYIASPSLLKKFVTGKGNAKKPEMAAGVLSRWGFESPSDDVVDSYGLARIAELVAKDGSMSLKGVQRG